MTDDGKGDSDEDGVKATEVLVRDDGTDDGGRVGPERVEGTNTKRGTLSHAQTTGLALGTRVLSSALDYTINNGQVLLDEVGVWVASVQARNVVI